MNMENTELHTEKVKILSRLIKESSLTLEEALLLLREEIHEEEKVEESSLPTTGYIYSGSSLGMSTITPSHKLTIGSSGTLSFGSTTTNTLITDNSVDLNN